MSATNRKKIIRLAGLALGALLTAAAVYVAASGVDWQQLAQAQLWQLVAMPALVLGNLLVTAVIFWIITRSYDASPKVPLAEMTCLIAASALLNYLPLRPGLLGRAAYLKLKYDLPVKQSVAILLIVLALGAAVLLAAATIVILAGQYVAALSIVTAILATLAVWLGAPLVLRRKVEAAWSWVPLRLVDLALGSLRLWIAFAVVGQAVSLADAVVLAAAGMLIAMAGLTPNGLGLREWAIALIAGLMGTGDPTEAAAIAAAAALVDRAAEALVVAIAGSLAMTRVSLKPAPAAEADRTDSAAPGA